MMVSPDDFAHLKILLENIFSATNKFDHLFIKDDFGKTYSGQLLRSGELIEIDARRFKKKRVDEIEQHFWMEIFMLSTLKHKNLVSLVGFCDENDEKIIITRRETRGSLNSYLNDPVMLTWVRRLEISVGIAQALSYIHYDESRDFSVIHLDIDSVSIQLNEDWEPKFVGFIRSMKIKASERHNSFHTNTVQSAYRLGDPTYRETMNVNHKSDMYSFGILLIELLGIWQYNLVPRFITHYLEEKLDNIINKDLWKQLDMHSLNMFAEIAYECLDEERSRRPNIDDIVPRLEKTLELARENRLGAVEVAMEEKHGPDASQHPPHDFDVWEEATGGKKKGNLVGLGTRGDPRLLVTSRTSSSFSSLYAHHTGSEQVRILEETVRKLQEDIAQMRSREIEMQVQLQRQVEQQVQEHMHQRDLEVKAREEARERE